MAKRVALVTGCSTGIGYLLVETLLKEGWAVIATMRNVQERQNLFADAKQQYSEQLHLLEGDVTDAKQRQHLLEFVENKFQGKLDALMNNAGFGVFGAVGDCSEEQIRQQFEVNYFGLVFLTNLLLPTLLRAKGHIINISSVLGFSAIPLSGVYASSKWAVEGISEALAIELAPAGVKVTVIEPGGHKTEFGKNLVWAAKRRDPNSPFIRASENYEKFMGSTFKQQGASAENVIRAITRALNSKYPPLRIRCGKDSHLTYWLRWLLPLRVYIWAIRFGTRMAYYRGVPSK